MYLRSLYFYTIFSTQYFFYGATPIIGRDVRIAYLEEFPFVVSLSWKIHVDIDKQELDHFCGGSLITHSHVLTAAHCIKNKQLNDVVVKIGSIDLRNAEAHDIKWWIKYSQWANVQLPAGSDVDFFYDIAILRLCHGVSSDIGLPILSYTNSTQLYGKSFTTAGWGQMKDNKKPRYMRIGKFFVVPPEKCTTFLEIPNPLVRDLVPKLFLCTQAAPFAMITCGDSGSPLFSKDNHLIGINKCFCLPKGNITIHNLWNVQTFVSAFAPFIEAMKKKK